MFFSPQMLEALRMQAMAQQQYQPQPQQQPAQGFGAGFNPYAIDWQALFAPPSAGYGQQPAYNGQYGQMFGMPFAGYMGGIGQPTGAMAGLRGRIGRPTDVMRGMGGMFRMA